MKKTETQLIDEIAAAITDSEYDRTALLLDEWSNLFSTPPPSTALTLAGETGSLPIITLLLSRGSEVTDDAVIAACEPYNVDTLQAFLDSGWDINTPFGYMGDLLILCLDSLSTVKWVLSNSADPNLNTEGTSRSALELAAKGKPIETIETLIAAGAHINNTNVLKIVATEGRLDIIELLVEKGAEINEISSSEYYIHRRTDSEREDGLGMALYEAARAGQLAAVQLLLDKGADPTLKNTVGETPLEVARKEGHRTVVEVLKGRV